MQCLLAVLITATEAESEQLQRHVVSGRMMPFHMENSSNKQTQRNSTNKQKQENQ